jgi:hypothetical protein
MNGQWTGPYSGTNNGSLIVEVDDVGGGYEGSVIAINETTALPTVFGQFLAPKDQKEFPIRVFLTSVERSTGNSIPDDQLKQRFLDIIHPKYADSNWSVDPEQITVQWTTDIGTSGSGRVKRSAGSDPSNLLATDMSWDEFKSYATNLEPARYIFRGQGNDRWKLRTAFHRTGRANLQRFMRQDVNALYRHLTGLTAHRFNLESPLDYAAFLALVQHHGYPTPLLDWTLSPFIAAYFAFRNISLRRSADVNKVRVHVLDSTQWNQKLERAAVLAPPFLHMTILEPLALSNPRVLPQQGVSLVTNVDDLETYVAEHEKRQQTSFLTAIDISVAERPKVMRELALMGINAGSLFPGLDGACNQLKERYFDL